MCKKLKRRHGRMVYCVYPGLKMFKKIVSIPFLFSVPLVANGSLNLNEALTSAYHHYPELLAQRAALEAADEGVSASIGAYRPKIAVESSAGRQEFKEKPSSTILPSVKLHPKSIGASVEQPLYQWGRLSNGLKKSEQDVMAGRANLRLAEQKVFLQVIAAYMNTLRDEAIVKLNEKNVAVFQKTYRVAHARFEVGQISNPDLAQAKAYLSEATANLEGAKGTFLNTKTTFEKLVGKVPQNLIKPVFTLKLPLSSEEALLIAEKEHPLIHGAEALHLSARFEAERIRSDLFPALSLKGTTSIGREVSAPKQTDKQYAIMAELKIPIYSGGITEAKTRGARHIARQKMLEKELRLRDVKENVLQSFETLKTLDAQIQFRKDTVKAQKLTAEGRYYEVEAGAKTIVDLGEAERDLLLAETELTKTETAQTLERYGFLAAPGRLNAETLALKLTPYDATRHLKKARRQLTLLKD